MNKNLYYRINNQKIYNKELANEKLTDERIHIEKSDSEKLTDKKIDTNKKKIGNIIVDNINDVINDIQKSNCKNEKNGYSFLIRIKNEEGTIEKCILDIVNLVDEIIIVDNNSSDNTLNIILDLEQKYDNVFVYQYKINIPRVGKEHIDNLKTINKNNTLTNYYNWTASKASFNKKIKWDGDFYTIKENLLELLNNYRNFNDIISVWFSGLTLFIHNNNNYLKNNSYYNEYRLFCNKDNKIWYNIKSNSCETSSNFVDISKNYRYTKPIFIEIKNTNKDEFTSRSTLLNDGRDNIDYDILTTLSKNKMHKLLIPVININEDYKKFILQKDLRFLKVID